MTLLISCEMGGTAVPEPFVDAVRSALSEQRGDSSFPFRHDVERQSSRETLTPAALPDGAGVGAMGRPPATADVVNTADAPIDLDAYLRGKGDQAASTVARRLTDISGALLMEHRCSPMLIDVTRSLHHRGLFSPLTRGWKREEKKRLIEAVYRPYREQIRSAIRRELDRSGHLIHLSVSSFDAYRQGEPRRADVGLLYDPAIKDEVDFCLDWIDFMFDDVPMLRVRRNYPWRGTRDSLTRTMRAEFSSRGYLGIEVLLNRHWADRDLPIRDEAIEGMGWALQAVASSDCSDAA